MDHIRTTDIFCAVIDNYGDIGVCWRLARTLSSEHGVSVRIWVDDMPSFKKLCPDMQLESERQILAGVEICHWPTLFPEVEPAQLVIEAFACELPASYVQAMAKMVIQPVWINLEYLSAEDWVEGCHGLPSPHPQLPLVKYFFFPGFTRKTGGLIQEQGLEEQRKAFVGNSAVLDAYWEKAGLPGKSAGELRISLFCYANPLISALLAAWAEGSSSVTCLIPEGPVLPLVSAFFETKVLEPGAIYTKGRLSVEILPFVIQPEYDKLLWACDLNFVRGEDSCVRAQWAAQPFVWQVYPQHDGVHMKKLQAFLEKYCLGMESGVASAIRDFWLAWNGDEPVAKEDMSRIWSDLLDCRPAWQRYANEWARNLSGNNLALNLLDFSRKVGKMRAFGNQAGI